MNGWIKTPSTRPMMWLIVSLLAAGCACGVSPHLPTAPTPPAAAGGDASILQVDDVVLLIAESYPAQVVAQVTGSLADTCSVVDAVRQAREGARVTVTITTRRTAEACGQAAQPITLNVRLDGAFMSGEYVVLVNGVERRLSV